MKRFSRRSLLLPGLLAFLFGAPASATELRGAPAELSQYLRTQTQTVTLRETARETGYADVARVTLVVLTEDKALAEAISRNKELRGTIRRELMAAGIAADDIRTARYSASPQYGWFGKKRPSSYDVVNRMAVKVSDESIFQQVAGIADRYEEVQFGGAEFEHSEKQAYEDKVRESALARVMRSKAYFERSLGFTLRPVAFSFSDVGDVVARNFGLQEIVVTGNKSLSAGYDAAPQAPPTFDEIEYAVSVAVTFEIDSAGEPAD